MSGPGSEEEDRYEAYRRFQEKEAEELKERQEYLRKQNDFEQGFGGRDQNLTTSASEPGLRNDGVPLHHQYYDKPDSLMEEVINRPDKPLEYVERPSQLPTLIIIASISTLVIGIIMTIAIPNPLIVIPLAAAASLTLALSFTRKGEEKDYVTVLSIICVIGVLAIYAIVQAFR